MTRKTYQAWADMLLRCRNPNAQRYKNYGARGIKVCQRWHAYLHFLEDMGEAPEGKSLDRINNDGNYEPGNCRWATDSEQFNNRTDCRFVELNGYRRTITQWAKALGIRRNLVYERIRRGWPDIEALTIPALDPHSKRRRNQA